MAYTNRENPDCANCNKSGLAILPVRYSVVPNNVDANLPASLGHKVTDVKLKHHKYALRTLRQGFLYLFYERHARGKHVKWEVYSVSARGTLWKQISINAIEAVEEERCSRKEHSLPASIIAIDSPEKCGRVWIAFSEHAWSVETFAAFEQDQTMRDRRMQAFDPGYWVKETRYVHGLAATAETLNEIIEYKRGFPLSTLGRNNIAEISKPDGSYNVNGLKSCATRYPITVRRDDKDRLVDLMRGVGEGPKGHTTPIILALWDTVGITHELNGYRNDATGWIEKYGQERELEIGALSAIEGAKKALEDREKKNAVSGWEMGIFQWDPLSTKTRLENYDRANPGDIAGHARQADLCRRWEQDAVARVPLTLARRREAYIRSSEPDWLAGMAEIDTAVNRATTPNKATGKSAIQTRDELIKRRANEAEAEAAKEWSKYESRLDERERDAFKKKYAEFLSAASTLADDRTEDLVMWIRSPYLLYALSEFNPASLPDGTAFEGAIGEIIFGINSSPAGSALLKEWVSEGKVSDSNLLWRAVALNHIDGLSAVGSLLETAITSKEVPFTETTLHAARESTKYLAKVADLAKKALSLHNTIRKAGVYQVRTAGIEKVLITAGNLFFQPFIRKGGDYLSEKLIQGLLLARCGSEYGKIMALFAAEAKFGKAGRVETMLALSMGHAVSSLNASKGFAALEKAWADLAKDAETPKANADPRLAGGFNEAKELRFGIVATLAQLVYITKLYIDAEANPDNARVRGELMAAGLSLSAGIADLGSTAIKALHPLKDTALGFQALKLAGGALSAVSSWVMLQQDLAQSQKKEEDERYAVANLYLAKSVLNLAGGASSALSALSYTRPAFDMIAKKFPATFLGRAAALIPNAGSKLAARLFFGRALVMLGGIWFSVATLAIQLLIWKFSDDKLQEWCERSAFGIKKKKRIKNPKQQMIEFENSLIEVL